MYIYFFFYVISVRTLRTLEYSTDDPFITPGVIHREIEWLKLVNLNFKTRREVEFRAEC